jgi:hypothetical protein
LGNKALLEDMGAGGLGYVHTHFSAVKMRQHMESILLSTSQKGSGLASKVQ